MCAGRRSNVRGNCDSCYRVSELFQLPGREDNNCSECDSDISTMILLYEALNDAERLGMDIGELESDVTEILLRFLERCSLDYRETPQ
jgi:hypothetical protein